MSTTKVQRPGLPVRYRLRIVSRALLAIVGGYVVAAAFAAATSLWLPALGWMSRSEAVMLGTMLAFVVHAVLAICVFSIASERKAWATVLVSGLLLGILLGLGLAFTPGRPLAHALAAAGGSA